MIEHLIVTTLVENTAGGKGLLGEHGLSFLIEARKGEETRRILFDTGQGFVLSHNVKQLGISLHPLDAIVLSHGHYDHTGGLAEVLQECPEADLFVHPSALEGKYSPRGEIGAPIRDEEELRSRVGNLVWTTTPTELYPGICVTGTIPRSHELEDTGGNFWRDKTHQQIDTLPDDQALFINTPQGIVVILGCAHAGTINTLDYIKYLTGVPGFHAVLGGMHLLRATRERIEATAKALEEHEVRLIAPNHCTGMNAIAHLWQCFPDRVVECKVGSRLEFGDRG